MKRIKNPVLCLLPFLVFSACKTPPVEQPIAGIGKVYVHASSSGRDVGNPLEPSTIGAAEQKFTEVLMSRGYKVVKRDGGSTPKECTHYFEVTVNQAYVEPKGGRNFLHISVNSKLIDAVTRDIVLARSLPPSKEPSDAAGDIVRLVEEMAMKVALLYPPGGSRL